MRLTSDQETFLINAIRKAIGDDGLPLPSQLETDKVYRSHYYKYTMRGLYDLRFINKTDEAGGLYTDLFLRTDDMDIHVRIDGAGKTSMLENYEGAYGQPYYEDEEKAKQERARMIAHNEKVNAILKEKGLL